MKLSGIGDSISAGPGTCRPEAWAKIDGPVFRLCELGADSSVVVVNATTLRYPQHRALGDKFRTEDPELMDRQRVQNSASFWWAGAGELESEIGSWQNLPMLTHIIWPVRS